MQKIKRITILFLSGRSTENFEKPFHPRTEPAVEIILLHGTHRLHIYLILLHGTHRLHIYYRDELADGTITYPCNMQILIALLTMVAVKADIVEGLVVMPA